MTRGVGWEATSPGRCERWVDGVESVSVVDLMGRMGAGAQHQNKSDWTWAPALSRMGQGRRALAARKPQTKAPCDQCWQGLRGDQAAARAVRPGGQEARSHGSSSCARGECSAVQCSTVQSRAYLAMLLCCVQFCRVCWNALQSLASGGRHSTVDTRSIDAIMGRPPFEGSRHDGALDFADGSAREGPAAMETWTRPFDVSASAPLFTLRARGSATQTSISPSRSSLVSPQLAF